MAVVKTVLKSYEQGQGPTWENLQGFVIPFTNQQISVTMKKKSRESSDTMYLDDSTDTFYKRDSP